MIPSLLLSPDGSYSWSPEDGVQVVTPTVGASVEVVEGQYGDAWRCNPDNRVSVPAFTTSTEGTILVRLRYNGQLAASEDVLHIDPFSSVSRIRISIASGRPNVIIGNLGDGRPVDTGITMPNNMWTLQGARYDGVNVWNIHHLGITEIGPYTLSPTTAPLQLGAYQLGGDVSIESALIYPEALPDAEIHRISTMPEAWTMENVSTPSMRVKQSGAVVRVAGMYTKRMGLLKEVGLR